MFKLCACLFAILMVASLLAGCEVPKPELVVVQEFPAIASTATASLEPIPTATPSPTFTATLIPTLTPTITPTPTLALPVDLAEIFPKPSQPISIDLAAAIRELATSGSPHIYEVRISKDGKIGYAITSAGIKVYDMETKEMIRSFPVTMCTQNYLTCFSSNAVTMSSDGRRFAILNNESIQLWSLAGDLLLELPLYYEIYSYSFGLSFDGRYFAVTGSFGPDEPYNQVSIYEIDSGDKILISPEMQGRLLKYSPTGSWLAIWDYFGTGTLWRTADWSKHTNLFFQSNEMTVEFSPDDQFIVMMGNDRTSIYQIDPWKLRREFTIQNDQWARTYMNFFSPSSDKFAVMHSSYNRQKMESEYKIWVWDLNTGELLSETQIDQMNPYYAVSDDGSIDIQDNTEELWPIIRASNKIQRTVTCMENCSRMYISPEGDRFELWHFNWEIHKNKKTSEFCTIKPGLDITCNISNASIFLNDDGRYYTVQPTDTDKRYEVYDDKGTLLGAFNSEATENTQEHLWLSPRKDMLLMNVITQDLRATILWNIQSETIVKRWSGYAYRYDVFAEENLVALLFDRDGKLVIYDYEEEREVHVQTLNSFQRGAISFTRDGSLIFTSRSADSSGRIGSSRVQIERLHPETKEKSTIARMEILGSFLDAVAQSPDGKLLAAGSPDGYIHIFNSDTGDQVHQWKAHSGSITQLEFSPDGTLLISYSLGSENGGDGLLKIWGIWP